MLILLKPGSTDAQVNDVIKTVEALGYQAHAIPGKSHTAIGITGNEGPVDPEPFLVLQGVSECIAVTQPYKLVGRSARPEGSIIKAGSIQIGGGHFTVMAGPCAVESKEQILATAKHVKQHGAAILRGGAFKPRSSPYAFQGLKEDGLKLLEEARNQTGLPIITEVKDVESLEKVVAHTDILQIGARNMQNYSLLEAVGEQDKPVMLKRGLCATVKEWLMSAEYIAARGNLHVMLCERGIRTYETTTRNTLDLGILPSLREMTHLPLIVDPSHGTGIAKSVPAMARAAFAAGADGIMVEVHPDPAHALSDGPQSLNFAQFSEMMAELKALSKALNRPLAGH
ncbi:MAG: 3-deoxy-7-phosphoheptulonate synthase [Myxococcales bacterium]|nr:MAG: 3-deoxy-7-phosphoheptulonate synthase [Myxococcales bacterium]